MKKTQNLVSENEFGESLCHLIYLAQSGEEAKSIDLSAELQKQYGNALASAPEVGEAVGDVRLDIDGRPFVEWVAGAKLQDKQPLYTTPQPDRTTQLEAQLAERDEEIERLQSYEQGLNDVIEWMKERGLYHDADYFGEVADFASILTEHEQQVSACTEREIKKDNKRLVEALRKTCNEISANDDEGLAEHSETMMYNRELIAEMGAKG